MSPPDADPSPRGPSEDLEELISLHGWLGLATWVWDLRRGEVSWFGDVSALIGAGRGVSGGDFGHWLAHVHPDDRAASRLRFQSFLKGEIREYRAEERVVWPDGSVHWLETRGRGRYAADGRALVLAGVARDITDRRAAELAAREGADRLHRLLERAPVGIGISRGDIVTYGNPRFVDLFARGRGDGLLGRAVSDLVAPASRAALAERSRRRELGEPVEDHYEMMAMRLDGTEFPCRIAVSDTSPSDDGSVLVFVEDITEQRRADQAIRALTTGLERRVAERTEQLERSNQALNEAVRMAEGAMRAKGDFLANMSHEIRTPLNAVLGMADLALRLPDLSPRGRDYLTHIQGAGESLLGLLNDILDFSKIESGRLDIEHEEFLLQDVLDRVTTQVALKADEKGLDFLLDTVRTVPARLVGDPLRLGQVLLNLCSNAVKFTARGEVVLATVKAGEPGDGRTMLRFSVRDTGIGIAPELLPRLFSPFDQLDGSVARRYGGTGLGLAISRQLVTLMGGEIGVRSEPGRGSEFWFTLPFALPAGAEAPAAPGPTLPYRHVLVVDDSASAREILGGLLQGLGCRAVAVASADDALARLEAAATSADPFDLVLLDGRLPEADGISAAIRWREVIGARLPPIVLVSAYGNDAAAWRARAAGFTARLDKPVTAPALVQALLQSAAAPPQPGPAPPVPPPGSLAGRRILLVEDNALNRLVATDLLAEVAGMRLAVATTGAEALAMLDAVAPELVLMDVQLPEMDGYEATRRLRQNPRWQHVPVIAMTAHALRRDHEIARAAGMNDVVVKPVEPEQLFERLRRWLPAPKPAPADSSIDLQAGLHRCMDRHDLYRRALACFRDGLQDLPATVHAALQRGDNATAAREMHSLASSAGAVGADVLAAVARSAELRLRGPEADAWHDWWPSFVRSHAQVLADLSGPLQATGG